MVTLCENFAAVANPYAELRNILLRTYGLSVAQRPPTCSHLLDLTGPGENKPSVLRNHLITLKPDLLDDVIQVLFFQKMPRYIQHVNPKDYSRNPV